MKHNDEALAAERYRLLVMSITERSDIDHRTIEYRSSKAAAGPLGRAQLAGG